MRRTRLTPSYIGNCGAESQKASRLRRSRGNAGAACSVSKRNVPSPCRIWQDRKNAGSGTMKIIAMERMGAV